MVSEPEALLRRLAANDERCLATVMAPTPEFGATQPLLDGQRLDRRIRVLVRLAALLAIGAPTTSLRWAVELAAASGADDGAVVSVLRAAAPAAGGAEVVSGAPRLALALGFDVELDGWDGV
jgi:4-carboxymuconolactone decarboxylase